jgi:hypothetical protein
MSLDPRDLSLVLRAVCYGAWLVDERLLPFVTKAARVAVKHIDLELVADDHL